MKLQPETIEAMYHAGYRGPETNPLICSKCPSVARGSAVASRFYCRRHGFYVHSLGYCPDHGKPLPGTAPSPFRQLSLFSPNERKNQDEQSKQSSCVDR